MWYYWKTYKCEIISCIVCSAIIGGLIFVIVNSHGKAPKYKYSVTIKPPREEKPIENDSDEFPDTESGTEDDPYNPSETNNDNSTGTATRKPTSELTVFAYNNFGFPSKTFHNIGACLTFPEDWQRRASSVITHNTCVVACEYKGCNGRCITIAPGTIGHNRLRDVNFEKRIASVRPC